MSGGGWWSGLRQTFGAYALPCGDVQGLKACNNHYETIGCENNHQDGFEFQETKGFFNTAFVSSKAPLTDADFEKADEPSSHGFLGKEASDIEEHFHNLQVYLKGEGGFGKERMLGHFAVMQVAHEWRLFSWMGSNSMVLWDMPGDKKAVLEKRRQLIRRITDDREHMEHMKGFPELVETFREVDQVLDRILDRWDIYHAQIKLGDQLRGACKAFERSVLHSIEFSVFVFLGDACETFQAKAFLQMFLETEGGNSKLRKKMKELASTSFGKILGKFLSDPSFSYILDADSEPLAVQGVGPLRGLTELIKDEKWQEIFTMFGLEQPPSVPAELFTRGHGLVEASVCHFSPDECAKVLEAILKLWEATLAAANARQLLHRAAELARLGGELMMWRQVPKKFLDNILCFAAESLEATKQHFQALQKWDQEGSTRVSMNLNRGNFFQKRNSKIKIWEENRKRAEQVGTRLKQHIQDLEVLIKDMKESLSKVTSPEVLYETAKSVKDLCASSYDVFSEFNGWRNFQLADAELTFLKTAHLETATTATSAPRPLELCDGAAVTGNSTIQEEERMQKRHCKTRHPCLELKQKVWSAYQNAHELPEQCVPNFQEKLLLVWLGAISAGKSTSINQLLNTGVQIKKGQGFSPAEFLPVSFTHCTKTGWYISAAGPNEKNSVCAWIYDEQGWKEIVPKTSFDDLEDLAEHTQTVQLKDKLDQAYCASPDQCLGYVEIKLMKETLFTTTVFDHVHGQEPELKCLKWKRPSILDHAILLDPPGINYRGEAVHWAQESMSYVQRVASGRPCVFVWCMHKGHGGLASESRFVLELASRAPSCILPVVTRYNENMGPRNHPNTEKHLKKLLDESKSRDPEKADEVQRARQLYKALQKEIPLHILAQEMNEFMKKIYNTIPSQRPAAVLGLVDFQNNGQELDRALLDAFQTALQRRVVKDSDLRVVLAEIVRLEQNTYNHMAKLMNMGQDLCEEVLDEEKQVRTARDEALKTYVDKTNELLREVIEKLPEYISEAHEDDQAQVGRMERAFWGATGYDTRLLEAVLQRLCGDMAKESEYRRDALVHVGEETRQWFKESFGPVGELAKDIRIKLRGKPELKKLLDKLTDFSELEESWRINGVELPMFSFVQRCQHETSEWEEADKKKLQDLYYDADVPELANFEICFETWNAGRRHCIPCQTRVEPDGRFFGNPTCAMTGGAAGISIGAACIRGFEIALLSSTSALVALASVAVATFIHLRWEPEVQMQELQAKLKKTLHEEVRQAWKKEEAELKIDLRKTALRVTQMYVAQRAQAQTRQLGQDEKQALTDALEYQRLLSENKALLQDELQRRMADDLPKVNSLLEDERKQLEARKVMGQPPKFIVANGNPENPLLVNPQRIMTHEGRSTVVSGDLVANHPGIVYEREVFPPSECHVATFLLLEWLHQALEMETGNSLASLPGAPAAALRVASQAGSVQGVQANERHWDHLFGAGCGR